MHIHLEAVGGIAGDMFIAALLDAKPELAAPMMEGLAKSQLFPQSIMPMEEAFNDGIIAGRKFTVKGALPAPENHHHHHHHTHYSQIKKDIEACPLAPEVKTIAIGIFHALAKAEAAIHGTTIDKVAFHEVGAFDSIVDIVGAAWLIHNLGPTTWSISPLPVGDGFVDTAHGKLPLPAPATARLLKGFQVYQDGLKGERVTPTGAAIVKYLKPSREKPQTTMTMGGMGYGFGSKRFKGISNVLRASLLYRPENHTSITQDTVTKLTFEVDDQTPEDLALALNNIRAWEGTIDVIHTMAIGKKGRHTAQIQVLAVPLKKDEVVRLCFTQTTTLGIREEQITRHILSRRISQEHLDQGLVQVKTVLRPDGTTTAKTEIDSVAQEHHSFSQRSAIRQKGEHSALKRPTH